MIQAMSAVVLTAVLTTGLPPAVTVQIPPQAEIGGVDPAEVRRLLEKRLEREKRFAVNAGQTRPRYVLTVVSCLRSRASTVRTLARRDPLKAGQGTTTDEQMGVELIPAEAVELTVRLTWDDAFLEVSSASETRLKAAVDTVVKRLARELGK